ncbi:MAG: glycine-rich domain-containing protein [Enterocloster bolteae]
MKVNSLLSFNVAAYSGRRVLAKWQNPKAAAAKPYSGVYIRYSTSGYPGKAGGMQIYKGAGNNTASGAWSQQYLDMPNLNETYYFSIYPYVTCSAGELTGEAINAIVRTAGSFMATITNTKNYTIPEGYTMADIFCVGGGGGGGGGYWFTKKQYQNGGGGGAGGYTATASNIGVAAGQILSCSIGGGGRGNSSLSGTGGTGGTTSVSRDGVVLCTANGGNGGYGANSGNGGKGGSNGGDGGYNDMDSRPIIRAGDNGYSDGRGTGSQGRTTRAWGEPSGTLYAGGGGGGGVSKSNPGAGGAGGGGAGGMNDGNPGSANTGGGGGGGGGTIYGTGVGGGTGGSGVILIRLK